MVLTYKQKEWQENNTSTHQHPAAIGQEQQGCMVLSSKKQAHPKNLTLKYGERW